MNPGERNGLYLPRVFTTVGAAASGFRATGRVNG